MSPSFGSGAAASGAAVTDDLFRGDGVMRRVLQVRQPRRRTSGGRLGVERGLCPEEHRGVAARALAPVRTPSADLLSPVSTKIFAPRRQARRAAAAESAPRTAARRST